MPLRIPSDIDFIETAAAPGGAIVTAVRLPADHAIYVVCSYHGTQVANVYGPEAGHDEIRVGRTAAVICTQAHAHNCTATRAKRSMVAQVHAGNRRRALAGLNTPVPLTDATRESQQ